MRTCKEMTFWNRLRNLSLVALVVYFTHVNPYVHIHHSHSEGGRIFALNLHPTNIDGEGLSDRHIGVLHGHSLEMSYDTARRLQTNFVRKLSEVPPCYSIIVGDTDGEEMLTRWVNGAELISKFESTEQIDYRGPPIIT